MRRTLIRCNYMVAATLLTMSVGCSGNGDGSSNSGTINVGGGGSSPTGGAAAGGLAQPAVVAPIASARTPEQLAELLPSVSLTLTEGELAKLDDASR